MAKGYKRIVERIASLEHELGSEFWQPHSINRQDEMKRMRQVQSEGAHHFLEIDPKKVRPTMLNRHLNDSEKIVVEGAFSKEQKGRLFQAGFDINKDIKVAESAKYAIVLSKVYDQYVLFIHPDLLKMDTTIVQKEINEFPMRKILPQEALDPHWAKPGLSPTEKDIQNDLSKAQQIANLDYIRQAINEAIDISRGTDDQMMRKLLEIRDRVEIRAGPFTYIYARFEHNEHDILFLDESLLILKERLKLLTALLHEAGAGLGREDSVNILNANRMLEDFYINSYKETRRVLDRVMQDISSMAADMERPITDFPFYEIKTFVRSKLLKIAYNMKTKTIDHSLKIKTSTFDSRNITPVRRRIRIGIMSVAANPFHWTHLLMAISAMAEKDLDKVIFVIGGRDRRKPWLGEKQNERHEMGRQVLRIFAPFFEYSPIAFDRDHDGETSAFMMLSLNPDQEIDLFYLAGADHARRTYPDGSLDTIGKLEDRVLGKIENFGFNKDKHSINAIFVARDKARIENVTDPQIPLYVVPKIFGMASSTQVKEGDTSMTPYRAYEYYRKHHMYGHPFKKTKGLGIREPNVAEYLRRMNELALMEEMASEGKGDVNGILSKRAELIRGMALEEYPDHTHAEMLIQSLVNTGTDNEESLASLMEYNRRRGRIIGNLFKNYRINGMPVRWTFDRGYSFVFEDNESAFEKAIRAEKVMAIETHPDDIVINAGGTVAKLIQNGKKVIFVTAVPDQAGVSVDYAVDFNQTILPPDVAGSQLEKIQRWIRGYEARKGAQILGVTDENFVNLDLDFPVQDEIRGPTGYLSSFETKFKNPTNEDQKNVDRLIRTHKDVDTYLMVFPFSNHPHHRSVTRLMLNAIYRINPNAQILFWMDAREVKQLYIKQNIFFFYGDALHNLKSNCINAYESQNSRRGAAFYVRQTEISERDSAAHWLFRIRMGGSFSSS